MVEEKDCCCDVSASGESPICKECGNEGKPVMEITLKSLVRKSKLESVRSLAGFYFCETPFCEVVYFGNEQDIYLHKGDVTVRVGLKETNDPISICYCFGWTRKKILDQIAQQGFSTAPQEIGDKIKAGGCNCDVNNPSGRCCLGEVNKLVKQLQGIAGSA